VSEYHATVSWRRESADFTYQSYNRNHVWRVGERTVIEASAAPEYKGDGERIDPEEALVASLSSCHMLTFLAIAARKRLGVESYEDDAVGHMAKNTAGKMWVARVTLRPRIRFMEGVIVSPDELAEMHHLSHEDCFIANSVKTEVTVEQRD
jgi:organic hydroperoxide reductase OsmC/OhrA